LTEKADTISGMKEDEYAAVYVHWPFCISKCPYCAFASVRRNDQSLYDEFGDLLLLDLRKSVAEVGLKGVKSVFFGGGTPSLASPRAIEKILNFLFKNYPAENGVEITLEANPATFDESKIKSFKNAGINRLSLGVQSFFDKNLRFLGRIYDGKQAIEAAEIVSRNFENFSFDFMCGYETQTAEDLESDLVQAADFGCKHISCYQLTFEEGTPFYRKAQTGEIKKINENKEAKLFDLVENVLRDRDIFRYEVSNYSKRGFESRHNLAYWKYDDYLGIGPSACSRISLDGKKREMEKTRDPFLWKAALERGETTFFRDDALTEEEKLTEAIAMGLRLTSGITTEDLYNKVSRKVVDRIVSEEKLKFLREKKLVDDDLSKIRLTKTGFKKIDAVAGFLLE
jgi:oxygen-independent coproporphyrinogen-3 oxidase